jgi:maltose O-acetyltransferase
VRFRRWGIESINRLLLRVDRVDDLLELFGATIEGPGVLHGPLVINGAEPDYRNLHLGANVHLGRLAVLDLVAPITIGRDATVSMGTTILTHADVGDRPLRDRYPRTVRPTRIGEGAYLGANVTVLPGCDIGRRAVVGAGAVVVAPVPDDAVVAGVPARPIEWRSPAV